MRTLVRPLPRQYTFNLFTAGEISNEVATLYAALQSLGVNGTGDLPDISDEQWESFIWSLAQSFGPLAPDSDSVLHAVEGMHEPHLLAALASRCLAAVQGLSHAAEDAGPIDPAWLLLPATFAQRFEMLLGEARMPLVSVRQIDLLQL